MTELSVNAAELSVNVTEFGFSEYYYSFHTLNMIWLNFNKFYWIL
jgi:hypothetical protein